MSTNNNSENGNLNSLFETFKNSFSTSGQQWHAMNAHPFEEGSPMIAHGSDALNWQTGEIYSFDTGSNKWAPNGRRVNVTYSDGPSFPNKTIPISDSTHFHKENLNFNQPRVTNIPGTQTVIKDIPSADNRNLTHLVQPHETVTIKGNQKTVETSRAVSTGKVDLKITEQDASPRYIVQEKPIYVVQEKPIIVERPVYIEKPLEKPVIIEKTIERPVYVEKIIEKPVIIEKTVERPVYMVHERPGVIIDRDVKIEDNRKMLSERELKTFVDRQGLVRDENHQLRVAPPHLAHRQAGDVSNQQIYNTRFSHEFPHLRTVNEEEWKRLHKSNPATASTTNITQQYLPRDEEKKGVSQWGIFAPFRWVGSLFSSSGQPDSPSNLNYNSSFNSTFTPYHSDHAHLDGQLRHGNIVYTPDGRHFHNLTELQKKELLAQNRNLSSDNLRDRTFLRSGGLLENASSSAAEHYYRFGTPATVDHPTDPLQMDILVNAAGTNASTANSRPPFINRDVNNFNNRTNLTYFDNRDMRERMDLASERIHPRNEDTAPARSFNNQAYPLDRQNAPWISNQSQSQDWHLNNATLSNNEIIPPSLPHATVSDLGRAYGAKQPNDVSQTLGHVTETAANAVEGVVDVGKEIAHDIKRGVVKTIDATVEGTDKVLHKLHDKVHDTDTLKRPIVTLNEPTIDGRIPIDTNNAKHPLSQGWWM